MFFFFFFTVHTSQHTEVMTMMLLPLLQFVWFAIFIVLPCRFLGNSFPQKKIVKEPSHFCPLSIWDLFHWLRNEEWCKAIKLPCAICQFYYDGRLKISIQQPCSHKTQIAKVDDEMRCERVSKVDQQRGATKIDWTGNPVSHQGILTALLAVMYFCFYRAAYPSTHIDPVWQKRECRHSSRQVVGVEQNPGQVNSQLSCWVHGLDKSNKKIKKLYKKIVFKNYVYTH